MRRKALLESCAHNNGAIASGSDVDGLAQRRVEPGELGADDAEEDLRLISSLVPSAATGRAASRPRWRPPGCPPELTDKPHPRRIASATSGNVRGSCTISRADLAEYVLRAAADPRLSGVAVSVAKG